MNDGERIIRAVVCTHPAFVRGLKRIPDQQLRAQAIETLQKMLFLDLGKAPGKLHLHHLTNRKVPSQLNKDHRVNPFTIHVTPNDKYKASFTFEDGVAYFRVCDKHDIVDENP